MLIQGCKNTVIPDSVTSVGDEAFKDCTSLTSIIIPNSVTSIDERAFINCTSLASIILPDSVTSIGDGAFRDCTSLISITIPDSVTDIGWHAFGYYWDDKDYEDKIIDGFTIYGYIGSAAETYAKENGIKFVALDAPTPKPIVFPDVKESDWFYTPVQYCAGKGFIKGYADGTFGPADSLSRQDFVIILARIAGANLKNYKSCKLKDVDMKAYYGPAVAWATSEHIINGYADGRFGVGDPITREQVAVILYGYLGRPDKGSESAIAGFADKGKISSFAKDAMVWAVNNGVITGKDAKTLAPTATASRAEIATMITRMDQKGMF